ncbi:MAG: nitrilase-related carbon-nitrogen hydrolase [Pseudobdellovibrionaceae bacterium]
MTDKIPLIVTQASLNQTALDWPRNMSNIFAAIKLAAERKSDILSLEELAVTGYDAGDDFQKTDNRRILASLEDVAAYAAALDPHLIISLGHPWRLQRRDQGGEEYIKSPLYDRLNLPFNVQTLISNGRILAMTAKANLYNDGRGYEKRYFNEWSTVAANQAGGYLGTIDLEIASGCTIPFGRPIVHVTDGQRAFNLAQAICEEKWVATRYDGFPHDDSRYEKLNVIPLYERYLEGRDGLVLLIANASPPSRDKSDRHVHLDKLAARFADVVIDTDGLGSSGSTFAQFGHRLIVQDDKVLAQGKRISFARVAANSVALDINPACPATEHKAHALLQRSFRDATNARHLFPAAESSAQWDKADNPNRHYEEIIRDTALWLFDYMRKTGSRGIMEALSGGADSGFNSVMVSVMVHIGIAELGVDAFCNELGLKQKAEICAAYAEGGTDAAARMALQDMLSCVYMGTHNSSQDTITAARTLIEGGYDPLSGQTVKGIGGKFKTRNVQDLIDFYGVLFAVEDTTSLDPLVKETLIRDVAEYFNLNPNSVSDDDRQKQAVILKNKYPVLGDLVCATDGIAYENIQARARQVLVMLFANKEGKMAIANPNLDEARNAYATFGGDLHSGTINLNGHIPKSYQLDMMRYLYQHGLEGVMGPVTSLGATLKNKPTAELMPKSADGKVLQNDEDALQCSFPQLNALARRMLYERIDTLNGARRMNAQEIFDDCRKDTLFDGVSENDLYNMLSVRYKRWAMAQHKIHASPVAPTFGENVDHQTSLRTPNLSGNGRDELVLLGIHIMYDWAQQEGLDWNEIDKPLLERRAWQDEAFVQAFGREVKSAEESKEVDLRGLYERVRDRGWGQVLGEAAQDSPSRLIAEIRALQP